jgi:hypothetical protein
MDKITLEVITTRRKNYLSLISILNPGPSIDVNIVEILVDNTV